MLTPELQSTLDKLLARLPESTDQVATFARQLEQHSEFEGAAHVLELALERQPAAPLLLQLGSLRMRQRRFEQALATLTQVLSIMPAHTPTMLLVCECLIECRQFERAQKMLERARNAGAASPRLTNLSRLLDELQHGQRSGWEDPEASLLKMSPLAARDDEFLPDPLKLERDVHHDPTETNDRDALLEAARALMMDEEELFDPIDPVAQQGPITLLGTAHALEADEEAADEEAADEEDEVDEPTETNHRSALLAAAQALMMDEEEDDPTDIVRDVAPRMPPPLPALSQNLDHEEIPEAGDPTVKSVSMDPVEELLSDSAPFSAMETTTPASMERSTASMLLTTTSSEHEGTQAGDPTDLIYRAAAVHPDEHNGLRFESSISREEHEHADWDIRTRNVVRVTLDESSPLPPPPTFDATSIPTPSEPVAEGLLSPDDPPEAPVEEHVEGAPVADIPEVSPPSELPQLDTPVPEPAPKEPPQHEHERSRARSIKRALVVGLLSTTLLGAGAAGALYYG
ncbi:MAG: tetratricopeptide repeat protein, partial [Myxococcota bacterium]